MTMLSTVTLLPLVHWIFFCCCYTCRQWEDRSHLIYLRGYQSKKKKQCCSQPPPVWCLLHGGADAWDRRVINSWTIPMFKDLNINSCHIWPTSYVYIVVYLALKFWLGTCNSVSTEYLWLHRVAILGQVISGNSWLIQTPEMGFNTLMYRKQFSLSLRKRKG